MILTWCRLEFKWSTCILSRQILSFLHKIFVELLLHVEFLTEFFGRIPVADIVRLFLLLLHVLDRFLQILLFCLCIFLEMPELLLHSLH